MKIIVLSNGMETIVDDDVYESFAGARVHFNPRHTGYAVVGNTKNGTRKYLHRVVACAGIGEFVDHINGNTLDNRRCNLRLCTARENSRNMKVGVAKRSSFASSKYKGVYWDNSKNKAWKAHIRIGDGRQKTIGMFSSEMDAAKAYNEAAIKYHGEFAKLNIIKEV